MGSASPRSSLVLRGWLSEPGCELRVRITAVTPDRSGDRETSTVATTSTDVLEAVELWLRSLTEASGD